MNLEQQYKSEQVVRRKLGDWNTEFIEVLMKECNDELVRRINKDKVFRK